MKNAAIRTILTVLALAAASSAALAQNPQGRGRGMGGMGQQMGGPMRMAPWLQAYRPSVLLEAADELDLTADQRDSLETLAQREANETENARSQHQEHRAALMQALQSGAPDIATVSSNFWAAHASMGALHWTELNSALLAMQVLTQEQQQRAKDQTQ